jgi:hypothetical protein
MSLLLAVLTVCSLAFAEEKTSGRQGEEGVGKKSIEQVLRDHTPELMAIPGVVGTAEGRHRGAPCVEVYVLKKTRDLLKRIPTSLDGYRVIVRVTGKIRTIPEKPVEPSTEK